MDITVVAGQTFWHTSGKGSDLCHTDIRSTLWVKLVVHLVIQDDVSFDQVEVDWAGDSWDDWLASLASWADSWNSASSFISFSFSQGHSIKSNLIFTAIDIPITAVDWWEWRYVVTFWVGSVFLDTDRKHWVDRSTVLDTIWSANNPSTPHFGIDVLVAFTFTVFTPDCIIPSSINSMGLGSIPWVNTVVFTCTVWIIYLFASPNFATTVFETSSNWEFFRNRNSAFLFSTAWDWISHWWAFVAFTCVNWAAFVIVRISSVGRSKTAPNITSWGDCLTTVVALSFFGNTFGVFFVTLVGSTAITVAAKDFTISATWSSGWAFSFRNNFIFAENFVVDASVGEAKLITTAPRGTVIFFYSFVHALGQTDWITDALVLWAAIMEFVGGSVFVEDELWSTVELLFFNVFLVVAVWNCWAEFWSAFACGVEAAVFTRSALLSDSKGFFVVIWWADLVWFPFVASDSDTAFTDAIRNVAASTDFTSSEDVLFSFSTSIWADVVFSLVFGVSTRFSLVNTCNCVVIFA